MCGRFVIVLTPELVRQVFDLAGTPALSPRYNVAPSQPVPVIRLGGDGHRHLDLIRWGLVPSWAREAAGGLINARAETVDEKPSFRQAFRQRRCIIPASGFYEWHKGEQGKVPYFVHMADEAPMPFAGIWEVWRSPAGELLESCAILTTVANATVLPIHDRMPVILRPADFVLWLDRRVNAAATLKPLLIQCPPDRLAAYRVAPLVNSPANDKAECIRPLPATQQGDQP